MTPMQNVVVNVLHETAQLKGMAAGVKGLLVCPPFGHGWSRDEEAQARGTITRIALPSPPRREGAGSPPLIRGQTPLAQKSFPDQDIHVPAVSVDNGGNDSVDEVFTARVEGEEQFVEAIIAEELERAKDKTRNSAPPSS